MQPENLLATGTDDRNSLPGNDKHGKRTEFINIERRIRSHNVFHIEEFNSRSSLLPRPTHWSVAWSDLMMTMFILFLAMFVYQSANEEFLSKKKPEILGGDTTEALDSTDVSGASFPFIPIKPGLPIMTAGTIKKIETVHDHSPAAKQADKKQEAKPFPDTKPMASTQSAPEKIVLAIPEKKTVVKEPAEVLEPRPLPDHEQHFSMKKNQFQEIFTLSKDALESNNLEKFATVDLIPDKTMRIILTSDLLFGLGESELSAEAKQSLQKIAAVVRLTPYMINIVGHTDNIPMRSNRFKSNWELSVARASTVARFFIDNMGMNPNQFVVSGYASYRPLRPNTTAENRAKNRRVEIIISKRLPQPQKPTAENLK